MRSLPTGAAISLLLVFPALAQDAEIEAMRSTIRAEKKALVEDAMELDEREAAAFWPIYDDYAARLGELGDRRIELIQRYALTHRRLSDQAARDLAGEWLDVRRRRLKLQEQTWKRLSKALSPVLAARFLQVEHRIELRTDLEIASKLPPILP